MPTGTDLKKEIHLDFMSHLLPVTGILTPLVDASNEKNNIHHTIIHVLLVNLYVFNNSLVN